MFIFIVLCFSHDKLDIHSVRKLTDNFQTIQ